METNQKFNGNLLSCIDRSFERYSAFRSKLEVETLQLQRRKPIFPAFIKLLGRSGKKHCL